MLHKTYVKRLFISILFLVVNTSQSQTIDNHFFFLNNSLYNQDPVTYIPGSIKLLPVDYNEGSNTGYPSVHNNTFGNNKMIPFCADASKSIYNFKPKTGLKYNNGAGNNFDNYTISVIIKYNSNPSPTQYFRIIDFSNGTSDNGIYNRGNNLNFYPTGNVRSNVFKRDEYTFLTLTRDGTSKVIDVYIGDTKVTSYTDINDYYKIHPSGNLIFARDNIPPSSAPNEDTNGAIAYIYVTNKKSTASEVKDVYDNICSLIPPDIDAVDDLEPDANGKTGQMAIINVLENDTRNKIKANLTNVVLAETISDPTGYLTLNPDGTVDLAPNTPVGEYKLTYIICDKVYPSVCDGATVTVRVLPIPQITITRNDLICGVGSGELTASPSGGIVNWYATSIGGNSLFTGNIFKTPIVQNTTTFYVDATENWRITETRVPVTLTVNHVVLPNTSSLTQLFCDKDYATISDIKISGTSIKWYASPIGGSPIDVSEKLVNASTYYATQTINTCESFPRLAIDVSVFETVVNPTSPNNMVIETCDTDFDGDDTNGYTIFDLTLKESELLNGKSPEDFEFSYFNDSSYTTNSKIENANAFVNTIKNEQTIYVRIANNTHSICYTNTAITIRVNPLPILKSSNVELQQCDGDEANDGKTNFNLNEANELISNNYLNESFEFYEDDSYKQLIEDPISYQNKDALNSKVYVKIISNTNCVRLAIINLKVAATQIPNSFHQSYYVCDDSPSNNQDGIASFDFSSLEQKLIDTKPLFSSQQVSITYYESLDNALSEINAIQDISNYRNSSPHKQNIYARIDSNDVNACLGLKHIATLYVEALPIANAVRIKRQCDDDLDGIFPFDTAHIESTVVSGQSNVSVSYFDEKGTILPSPLPNPFFTGSQQITIKISNDLSRGTNACSDETTLEFIVDKMPVAFKPKDIVQCDDDSDGVLEIDTSTIENDVLKGQSGMLVSYFDELGTILPSPLPNPFSTTSQTITIKVENTLNKNCSVETSLQFKVYPKPEFELDEKAIYCSNLLPITIKTYNANGNYTYEWRGENDSITSIDSFALISKPGKYTVIASSNRGCKSLAKTIIVVGSSIASLTHKDIVVTDDSSNNTITILTENNNIGIGDYEYSLDDDNFQDNPFFNYVKDGIRTLTVRDKNDCGIVQLKVPVIGFPKFFTPNNDGFNDYWQVRGISNEFYSTSLIYIFNRFGKLIVKIDPSSSGWDGTFKGNTLPTSDYWFTVQLIDKKGNTRTKQGHFSLIR